MGQCLLGKHAVSLFLLISIFRGGLRVDRVDPMGLGDQIFTPDSTMDLEAQVDQVGKVCTQIVFCFQGNRSTSAADIKSC